jgi:DNA-binding protein HU-beta
MILLKNIKHERVIENMTKKELAVKLAQENDLSKAQSEQIIELLFEEITNGLKAGDEVAIPGFGKFAVTNRKERTGLNPQTKEKILIPASKKVKFRAAKQLKELVNN